ncbi:MAG: RNA polymerase sigma factor [Tannerellaceae bacterium]|nr:RNA polymerase sigma factor [Tannerellaceae bacterium]
MVIISKDKDFSIVYNKYIDDLYSYGISLGFGHDMTLDAIQDIFYTIYARINIHEIENMKYYLFRSLKNRLFDIYRSAKKENSPDDLTDLPFYTEITVMDSIIEEEEMLSIQKKVEELLKLLTNRQREAVYLRYMQGFEYEKIGELLNMTGESARKLVHRGIEKIRHLTGNTYFIYYFLAFHYSVETHIYTLK